MPEGKSSDSPCYALRLIYPFVVKTLEGLKSLDPQKPIPAEFVDSVLSAASAFIGDPDFYENALQSDGPNELTVGSLLTTVDWFQESLNSLDPDTRIPMVVAHRLLELAVDFFEDPGLGLKAGRSMSLGDIGVLGYAMRSAATVRQAIEVSARYASLINDALQLQLEFDKERAFVRMENQLVLPRSAEDFQVSSYYICHKDNLFRGVNPLEAWFVHPEPQDLAEYRLIFGSATIRFSAPFCGFVFDKKFLDAPLHTADFNLHSLTRKYADLILAELPKTQNFTEKTRRFISDRLPHGQPNVEDAAQRMNMSSRTLARRLETEGTTYKALLDNLRRRLASQYVANTDISLAEVTFLLGYAQTTTFYRAFKRWTGKTPLEYRNQHSRQDLLPHRSDKP